MIPGSRVGGTGPVALDPPTFRAARTRTPDEDAALAADAPDVDPAEPRPDGGCCGGACCG